MSVATWTPVVIESGEMRTEEQICAVHSLSYFRTYIPRLQAFVGQCEACKTDQRLSARAGVMLAERSEEIGSRVVKGMADAKGEIRKRVEADLARYVESELRPLFKEDITTQFRDRLRAAVETEILAEIVEELRRKEAQGG